MRGERSPAGATQVRRMGNLRSTIPGRGCQLPTTSIMTHTPGHATIARCLNPRPMRRTTSAWTKGTTTPPGIGLSRTSGTQDISVESARRSWARSDRRPTQPDAGSWNGRSHGSRSSDLFWCARKSSPRTTPARDQRGPPLARITQMRPRQLYTERAYSRCTIGFSRFVCRPRRVTQWVKRQNKPYGWISTAR